MRLAGVFWFKPPQNAGTPDFYKEGFIIDIFVQICSIMWRFLRLWWVGAPSWELAASSYGTRLTPSTQRTPQVAQRTPHIVETDPSRGAVERRSKCCIFVQKSSIIEQNHDFETTVDYQNHNISKKHRCNVKTPSWTCRNFWPIRNPTNIEWYLFWPRPLAKLLCWAFWPPEELTCGCNLVH